MLARQSGPWCPSTSGEAVRLEAATASAPDKAKCQLERQACKIEHTALFDILGCEKLNKCSRSQHLCDHLTQHARKHLSCFDIRHLRNVCKLTNMTTRNKTNQRSRAAQCLQHLQQEGNREVPLGANAAHCHSCSRPGKSCAEHVQAHLCQRVHPHDINCRFSHLA